MVAEALLWQTKKLIDGRVQPASPGAPGSVRVGWLVTDGDEVTLRRDTLGQGYRAAMLSAIYFRYDDCLACWERGGGGGNDPFGGNLAEFEHALSALQPQPNLRGIARG